MTDEERRMQLEEMEARIEHALETHNRLLGNH
jgi:hypothetical protein